MVQPDSVSRLRRLPPHTHTQLHCCECPCPCVRYTCACVHECVNVRSIGVDVDRFVGAFVFVCVEGGREWNKTEFLLCGQRVCLSPTTNRPPHPNRDLSVLCLCAPYQPTNYCYYYHQQAIQTECDAGN